MLGKTKVHDFFLFSKMAAMTFLLFTHKDLKHRKKIKFVELNNWSHEKCILYMAITNIVISNNIMITKYALKNPLKNLLPSQQRAGALSKTYVQKKLVQ